MSDTSRYVIGILIVIGGFGIVLGGMHMLFGPWASGVPEGPKGALTYSLPMEITPSCPKGREVIYPIVQVNTNWETGNQNVRYSWQCTSVKDGSDTYRVETEL